MIVSKALRTHGEHMVKFKCRSGMKQYIKSKSIKWGFKV